MKFNNTYVYNGKKDLKKKEYENKIGNNYDKDFKRKYYGQTILLNSM